MNPMKAIIFDFGNVVGFFNHRLTLDRLAPHSDMSPQQMFEAVYNGGLEDDFEAGRISQADFLSRARTLCQLRCDEAFMARAFADIFHSNPEVCGLIPALKGRYRLLLGSNTNELHAAQFLKQFEDVLGHFDDLVLSCRINVRKPNAGFFRHCHELAGCPAAECLFIDDMPANVAGAQAFGLRALVYKPEGDLAQRLEDHGIHI
jgi:glucose-1-phosphatase